MRNYILLLMAAIMSLSPTQGYAKKITYNARISAKFPIAPNNEPISVYSFSGEDGPEFADILTSTLKTADLDGQPVLNVQAGNAEIGIAGAILDTSVYTSNFTREEKECVNWKKFLKCEQWEKKYLSCQKVTGTYSATPKAIRLRDKKLLFSQNVKIQGEYTTCEGQQVSGKSFFGPTDEDAKSLEASTPSGLRDELRAQVAQRIRELVAPYNKLVKVKLMEKADNISKASAAQYKSGLAFADATPSRLDRACSIFQEIYASENNRNSVALTYNMGVCNEILLPDDPSAALDFYNKADQLLKAPDKDVSTALARAKEMTQQSSRIP